MPAFVSLASGTTRAIPVKLAAFAVATYLLYLIAGAIIPETRGRFE